jgi:hypothetical protein
MLWMMTDVFTRIGAAVGTALGVFNAWLNWRQRRVQAQLQPITVQVPRFRSTLGGTDTSYVTSPGLKFINRSPFALTLQELGYEFSDGNTYRLTRLPDYPGERSGPLWAPDKLPQRMEPRSFLRAALWDDDEQALMGKKIVCAYAVTACGSRFKVSRYLNRELRNLARDLASGRSVLKA